jgi:DNA-binding transcriptional MocR family regulator
MAQRLSVSRNTVNAALEQLAMEGYLRRDRRGSRVTTLLRSRGAGLPRNERCLIIIALAGPAAGTTA